MKSENKYPNLGIMFNLTGGRNPDPLVNILSELNPKQIFLTPNSSHEVSSKDQENRNFPLDKVIIIILMLKQMRSSFK